MHFEVHHYSEISDKHLQSGLRRSLTSQSTVAKHNVRRGLGVADLHESKFCRYRFMLVSGLIVLVPENNVALSYYVLIVNLSW